MSNILPQIPENSIPPRHAYGISANHLKAQALTRQFMSVAEAARLDAPAFLVFAAEVERVAGKLRGEGRVQQLEMAL